jgi:hypothetical protein
VPTESSAAYTEGWQGVVYRWLAKRIDWLARKLSYPSTRRGVRMWLEDVADSLVWRAIKRGWK